MLAIVAAMAVVVIGIVGTALSAGLGGRGPSGPISATTPTPPASTSPTPGPTSGPAAAPTPSPRTPYLIALGEGGTSGHPTSIRVLDSQGGQVQAWALKSGVRVLGAAGNRIFVASSGELKAIDSDGTVEDLGPFGGDEGQPFVASADGHRWAWIKSEWAGNAVEDIYVGGDAMAYRVFRQQAPVELAAWTTEGLLLRVPWGVGDWWPFGVWLGKEFDLLNADTGTKALINTPGQCSVTDVGANGAYACLTGGLLGMGSPSVRVVWPDGTTTAVELPQPAFGMPGALAFSPSGSIAIVGGVTGGVQSGAALITGEVYSTAVISKDGTLRLFGPAQARPAFGGWMSDPAGQSWLPDGRLLMWRPKGAAGGQSGLYWVTQEGAPTFTADDGQPIGVLIPG